MIKNDIQTKLDEINSLVFNSNESFSFEYYLELKAAI